MAKRYEKTEILLNADQIETILEGLQSEKRYWEDKMCEARSEYQAKFCEKQMNLAEDVYLYVEAETADYMRAVEEEENAEEKDE